MTSRLTAPALMIAFLALPLSSAYGEDREDTNPLKAVFSFQLCVRQTTDNEIQKMPATPTTDWSTYDADLWHRVSKACQQYFGDEQKGLILLHYSGDTSKALAFYQGAVASARAYVVSRSIDVKTAIKRK